MKAWFKSALDVHNLLMYALVVYLGYVCVYKTWQEIAAVGSIIGTSFGFRTWYGVKMDGPNAQN